MMNSDSYIIFSNHFGKLNDINITVDLVGQKSLGLLNCPDTYTPKFFIITSKLFNLWKEDKIAAEDVLKNKMHLISKDVKDAILLNYIVRSSAKIETFEERGFYRSSTGSIHFENLINTITETWQSNLKDINKFKNNEFGIIIQ